MADSTGPIVLTGAVTTLNDYIQGRGMQWRTVLATGLAAGVFVMFEKANRDLAVPMAWMVLVASLITPRKSGVNPPVQTFLATWNRTTPDPRRMAT